MNLAQSPAQGDAPSDEDSDEQTEEFALRVLDDNGDDLSNKRFEVVCSGVTLEGSTDGDGWVRGRVPAMATQALVTVWTEEYPNRGRRDWSVAIEDMEGGSSLDGARSRLRNLGYAPGAGGVLDEATVGALRELQRRRGLTVSGELDDETASARESAHGS